MEIGEIIEDIIKYSVTETLNKSKEVCMPDDIIETDNIGEVIEKLSILHCRMWYLEDAIGIAKTDVEIADLKRKIDICFKQKRPKYVEAINRMINKSILDGKSLIEDSVKLYKGFDEPTYMGDFSSMEAEKEWKKNNLPSLPKPPLSRHIIEGTIGSCPKCGSTEARKYFSATLIQFGPKIGCIQPDCVNYYKNK